MKDNTKLYEVIQALKVGMRCITKNGNVYIVMEDVQKEDKTLILVRYNDNEDYGWTTINFQDLNPSEDSDFDIVTVYDVPEYNNDLLNSDVKGILMWEIYSEPASINTLMKQLEREEKKLKQQYDIVGTLQEKIYTLKGQ
jgi:hypothetical protein